MRFPMAKYNQDMKLGYKLGQMFPRMPWGHFVKALERVAKQIKEKEAKP